MPDLTRDVDEYVRANYARFVYMAFLVVGNQQDAEDIVQDVLVRMVARWSSISSPRNPPPDAYVRRAILNGRTSLWRRPWRRRETSAESVPEQAPDHQLDTWVESQALLTALRQLDELDRKVLVAREVEGMSWQEIADALFISVSKAKRHQGKALERLRGLLEVGGD